MNSCRGYRVFICLAVVFLWCGVSIVWAGTTGKITGVVLDRETGDPLPAVNVIVPGTALGATTDAFGQYFILNLPVGVWVVEARLIGYTTIRKANVKVSADLTTQLDFTLTPEVLQSGEMVVVTAERPLLQRDRTASSDLLEGEDLRHMPVRQLNDWIALQAGVVQDSDGNLHVRGGRQGEIAYFLDGMELTDPLLGGSGTRIHPEAIEEIVINRGGFDAQYGDAMSGVVNIVTREGKRRYSNRLRTTWGLQPLYNIRTGSYGNPRLSSPWNLEGSLSGPLPGVNEKSSFFVSGVWLNDHQFLPHNRKQERNLTGNLIFRPQPELKLKLEGHYQRQALQVYDHRDSRGVSYDFNLDGLPRSVSQSYHLSLDVNHMIAPRTFYTAQIYHYRTRTRLAPEVVFDRYWRDWPGYSEDESGHYNGVIHQDNYRLGEDFAGLPFTQDNDFLPIFRRTQTTYSGFRFDLTSQVTSHNQLRTGVEGRWYDVQWEDKAFLTSTPTGEIYRANPLEGALYLQNKLELADFIVNVGGRLDYFDAGKELFGAVVNQMGLRSSSLKLRVSPRFGISHPVTEQTVVRINYGYFYQVPEYRFAYQNLQGEQNNRIPRLGNPDLNPQRTVAYELGLENLLTDNLSLGLTAVYRNLTNLTATEQVRTGGNTYTVFTNADFGTVRSLELSLRKRRTRFWSASLNYAFSIAEGNASDPKALYDDFSENATSVLAVPPKTVYLAFDQRHTASLVLDLWIPAGWHGSFLGLPLTGAWGLNLIARYGSGLPYTPADANGQPIATETNSRRLPYNLTVDLRFAKRLHLGALTYTLFTEVTNLLDRRNVLNVYANTGLPDDDGYRIENRRGDLANASPLFRDYRRLLSLDPQNFSPPREIRIGLEIDF